LKGKEKTKKIVLNAQIRTLPERQQWGKKEHEKAQFVVYQMKLLS